MGKTNHKAESEGSTLITMVDVGKVDASPHQTRSVSLDNEAGRQLIESIEALGVLQPILVRKNPAASAFTLIAGERRLRASQELGLKMIPARVISADDTEAAAMTLAENEAREDLSMIERALAAAELVKIGGGYAEAAAVLGVTERWVKRRAHLRNLHQSWIDLAKDRGHPVSSWSIPAFEAISRLPAEAQEAFAGKFRYGAPVGLNAADIKERLSEIVRLISTAPWNTDEAIGDLPACDTCPSNTATDLVLFGSPRNSKERAGTCMDNACWMTKTKLTVQALQEKLGDDTPVVKANDGAGNWDQFDKADGQRIWPENITTKKAGGVRAICAHGAKAGRVVYVDPDFLPGKAKGKEEPKEKKPPTMKEKRERLERLRWKIALEELQEMLQDASARLPSAGHVMAMAASLYTHKMSDRYLEIMKLRQDAGDDSQDRAELIGDRLWYLERLTPAKAAESLWERVRPALAEQLTYSPRMTPEQARARAELVAGLAGLDAEGAYQRACLIKTEPKSWKS